MKARDGARSPPPAERDHDNDAMEMINTPQVSPTTGAALLPAPLRYCSGASGAAQAADGKSPIPAPKTRAFLVGKFCPLWNFGDQVGNAPAPLSIPQGSDEFCATESGPRPKETSRRPSSGDHAMQRRDDGGQGDYCRDQEGNAVAQAFAELVVIFAGLEKLHGKSPSFICVRQHRRDQER